MTMDNLELEGTAFEKKQVTGSGAKYQVKHAIVSYLRKAILDGNLRPGEILHESDLTKQFKASRSPIREALVQLEQEGLVETIPKKGSLITNIDKAQLRQALFIRSLLEAENIKLLTQNISNENIATLKKNVERQQKGLRDDNYSEMYESMDEFHFLLCDFNHLPRIWEIIRREKVSLDRLHALNQPHGPRMQTLISQHIEIVTMLEERDSEKCQSLIRLHADIDFEAMKLVEEKPTEVNVENNSNRKSSK